MKKRHLVSAALALAMIAGPAFGQTVLFEDDFSTSGPGGTPDPDIWRYDGRSPNIDSDDQDFNRNTVNKYIEVTSANSAQYFGQTDNPYLRMSKESADGSLWVSAIDRFSSGSTVVTVAFDFYRPSTTAWGMDNTQNDPRFRLGVSDPIASNNNRVPHELRFANGSISGAQDVYSFDTLHSALWVYNHSSAEVGYLEHDLTIPASSFDLWIDGSRVIAGGGGPGSWLAVDTPLTSIGFAAFNNLSTEMFIDNLAVYEGAIPEPSTYALLAGALCLGLVGLRRRLRRRG